MNSLKIEITNNKTEYLPCEMVTGTCFWAFDKSPKTIELRFFWYTSGKGNGDVKTVEILTIKEPLREGERDFSFTLPAIPWSFSGKLISLMWAIEMIAEPGGETERLEITMSPSGKKILL
ncbi:MAG: hypothetical protein ABRQ39_19650 [Candidatus Eremiobacterota bacterium]